MKALEKDRNRRYETASAFAADVQRYLNDEPVQACPPRLGYRLGKMVRRRRKSVLAVLLVTLALVGGIIGTTWGMLRANDAEAHAVNEAKLKDDALVAKVAALAAARQSERDANQQLFLALLSQARAGRFSRQMGQRLDSLAALEQAARIQPDERLRDEATAAMALPDIRCGPSVITFGNYYAFDDLYQTYAAVIARGDISIRKVGGDEEIQCIKTEMKSTPPYIWLSPNGQVLAVLDEHEQLRLWHIAGGKLLAEASWPCTSLAFSPDSAQVAIANDDRVSCVDLASGTETARWRLPAKACALAFHPDNRKLAITYIHYKAASVYDSVEARHVVDVPVGPMRSPVVAWHPDGNRVALGDFAGGIQIWDVTTQRKLATLAGHAEKVTVLSFHPDGGLLASASWDGTLRLWEPATGRPLMQLARAAVPRFSSDGRWLGYQWRGGVKAQLLEVTPCTEYRTLTCSLGAGLGGYKDGDISPDGRLLVIGMANAGDRLWDLASGRELGALASKSHCVLFQDSRTLLTCGIDGMQRWPIEAGTGADTPLRLGTPRPVALPFVATRCVRRPDGGALALVGETAGAGVLLDVKTESLRHFAHPQACFVALSRDGRWAASSGWHSDRVRLWNARSGDKVHEWVLGTMTGVFFTPDSRSLIICRGDAFTFWDVETLQPIRRLEKEVAIYPGHVAFSPDGTLMALEIAPAVIHLKDVVTGQTVVKLEDPHGDLAGWMSFTPDGTQLVVASRYARAIHVWDLRAMRVRLKSMGLDWDWPEFGPVPALPPAPKRGLEKNKSRTAS